MEGLGRTLNIPKFWSSLTQTEQFGALGHLKRLFDLQLQRPDPFILIKLLKAAAYENVVGSVCRSRYLKDFIQICLRILPETKAELGMIVLRTVNGFVSEFVGRSVWQLELIKLSSLEVSLDFLLWTPDQ